MSLVTTKAGSDWFASEFPEQCIDGNGVCGTDGTALWHNVAAVIPHLNRGIWGYLDEQTDEGVFDLIEYAANKVAKPIPLVYHEYMKHHELKFDQKAGRAVFLDEVNTILQRGGTMFELTPKLQIIRTGTPAVQQVMQELNPSSGDQHLDGLLSAAKQLFLSRDEAQRGVAIDKLWDAFERLKTVDVEGNKKQSIAALLGYITNEQFRAVVGDEMAALTSMGNNFLIRHHETGKHSVPAEAYDYLFVRMGSLIVYLLKVSNRLG